MPSFRRPSHSHGKDLENLRSQHASVKEAADESALDTDSIDLPYLPAAKPQHNASVDTLGKDIGAIGLSAIPSYLGENRPRRRSSVAAHATHTVVAIEPPTTAYSSAGLSGMSIDDSQVEISAAQAAMNRRKSAVHFFALCYSMFLEGWNDGTVGPLLPTFQEYYHIGFAVVSMIFVLNCVGFISGAFVNVHMGDKLGFGKIMVFAACFQLVAYILQSFKGPFPLRVIANGFSGFGISFQNAHSNAFVAGYPNPSRRLGLLHASYGVGALVAPLVATSFARMPQWSFYYLISAGLAIINLAILISVFRFRTQDEVLASVGIAPRESGTTSSSKFRQILSIKSVHYLAFFALVYVGVEVTVGGWIVTFVIRVRDGGASSGYISSGFFGGIALGRVSLVWLNQIVGERRILFIYAILVIGLEATVWAVPSLIENAVAVSFMGLLLGPMYPILVNHATRVLPGWLLNGAIGWIGSFGQAGSAVFPFMTGLIASRYGIASLQPTLVAMMVTMLALWAIVPKSRRE